IPPERSRGDTLSVEDCRERRFLSCWVRAVRGDKSEEPKYLLVIGVQTEAKKRQRLSALLIDIDRALREYQRADRSGARWEEAVEDQIYTVSVEGRFRSLDIARKRDLKQYFEELFLGDLRPVFESSGHWRPFGEIALMSNRTQLTIEVDG